jgi:ABC-type nitrate/sulfonate/bicarbonate transport system ATPase subunit
VTLVAALRRVRVTRDADFISLRIERGERVALLGRNGVGKTTLLRMIAGLCTPTEGSAARGVDIGYAPQDYRASLFPWLTVRDNVALPARAGGALPEECTRRVETAARVADLSPALFGRGPGSLSGGEMQRVALARALASEAPLVLLDEPFAALDVAVRTRVRERLGAHLAARGDACVLVSHDLDDALALTTRWVVLGGPGGGVLSDARASGGRAALEARVAGA